MTSRGPNLINELYNLLIRFRAKPVALTGDIQEAFFQIRIRQSDQKLLNFLYRDPDKESSEDIQLIRFNVLTMGIPSASFELASCLRKIAELEKDESPEIADARLWDAFKRNVKLASQMRYPRYMFEGVSASDALLNIKLVTSGDSALLARTVHCLALATFNSGTIRTALVAAKTRINPVKKTKRRTWSPEKG